MKRFAKIIGWIFLSIVIFCISVLLVIRFGRLTDKMIYQNSLTYQKLSSSFKYNEQYITVAEDVKIHAALFKSDHLKPRGTIFHLQGRGMHLMSVQKEYSALLKEGFQIFVYERRGFGRSGGVPDNTLNLRNDALIVFDQMLTRADVKHTKIIIWGQSLGSAFAATVAAERNAKICGLILEGAFGSFPDIGKVYAKALRLENEKWLVPLIMNNDFAAAQEIKKVSVPTVIIHSIDDADVPYALGYKVFVSSNKQHTLFWKIRGQHLKAIFDYESGYVNRFNNLLAGKL